MNTKVVIITGASSGMGRATSIYLASLKYKVYATTRDIKKLQNLKSKYLIPIKMDIKDTNSVKKAIKYIKSKNSSIDILINNAGYGLVSSVEDVQEKEMLEQFNINVFGVFRVCKYVIPIMTEQNEGIIINISSFLGKISLPLFTFYNSSKYALEGITDSLRYELKDFNIRVHSILPGFFSTNFAKNNLKINSKTFCDNSKYKKLTKKLIPNIVDQINNGNDVKDIVNIILDIILDENYPARVTSGQKASKFIPMRKELSDEDFEQRIIEYYKL